MKRTHLQALLLNTMTAASAVHTPQKTTAGNVKSRKERHDMKWEKKKEEKWQQEKNISRTIFEALIPLCWSWAIVRKIELIPWAWTPSIFCLQSIFMNPQGFCRIKHINNQRSRWARVCARLENTQKALTTDFRARGLH